MTLQTDDEMLLEMIAEQIKEGNTEGFGGDGESHRYHWKLTINTWRA